MTSLDYVDTRCMGQDVRPIDLAAQERISRGQLPGLELVSDRFVRGLRGALTRSLEQVFEVEPLSISHLKFGNFVRGLPAPSSLHLFRTQPFPGTSIVAISHELVSLIVDRSMGGKGAVRVRPAPREYSTLDVRLVTKVVLDILETYAAAWEHVCQVDTIYVQHEQNPLALTIEAPTEAFVVQGYRISDGEFSATLQIASARRSFEKVRDQLASGAQSASIEDETAARNRLLPQIRKAHAEVKVELGQGKVLVRDVLDLKVGDVLTLDTPADEPAVISVEGRPKYRGRVGTSRGNMAVTIDRLILTDD